jgi:hypothetical protein
MSTKKKINELLGKIEAINASVNNEKIFNSPSFEDVFDNIVKDLPSNKELNQKLESLKSSRKNRNKKKQNKKDIFAELIGVVNKILESGRKPNDLDRFVSSQRLRRHAIGAAGITVDQSKEIIMTAVKDSLFSNDGICGSNKFFSGCNFDQVTIKPKEIDFLEIFTVSPSSDLGKILYEPITEFGKNKTNKDLYSIFEGSPYDFESTSNKKLFTATWNTTNQEFEITGLTQGSSNIVCGEDVKVEDFLNDYYSSIEMPDSQIILKNAMVMALNAGDFSVGGSNSNSPFNKAMNDLDRLLKKVMSSCGSTTKKDDLKNQNPTDLFDEDEEDNEFYFNFDDVEGIDLDDEDARLRRVLIFESCDRFEVPINNRIIKDFIFLENKKNLNDLINSTLNKASADAFDQSDGSFDLPSFQLSLNTKFLLQIPKAIIQAILTPKIFLPIVIIYKLFASTIQGTNYLVSNAKELMKKLGKMFVTIIKNIFWAFLREFWKRIKADLKNFIRDIGLLLLKSKHRKYYFVVSSLISFLKEIKDTEVNNCSDLFGVISKSIDSALNSSDRLNLKIPAPLLALSRRLPSLNSAKVMLDVISKLQSNNIEVGPINGETNKLVAALSSTVDGLVQNLSKAPISTTNDLPITVATPTGPGIIPPFTINTTGLFNT